MASGLLMAILGATIALPLWAARDPQPTRGLRRAGILFTVFVVLWAQALLHIFPALKK
jgi:hypothetical protein